MSPCIGICQMDDESGYCIGCGRTLEEISNWGSTSPEVRQDTMEQLATRPVNWASDISEANDINSTPQ